MDGRTTRATSSSQSVAPLNKQTTFRQCYENALQHTFNADRHHASWFEGFIGETQLQRNYYNAVEFIARPLTILKNSVRFILECLPEAIQEWGTSKFYELKERDDIAKMVGAAVISIVFFAIKSAARSFLAPILSFKNAWKWGSQVHPALGVTLCVLSVAASFVLGIAVGIWASPLLMASFLGAAAQGIASLPGLSVIGEKAAWFVGKMFGANWTETKLAVSAAVSFLWTAILTPFRFLLKKWGEKKIENPEGEPVERLFAQHLHSRRAGISTTVILASTKATPSTVPQARISHVDNTQKDIKQDKDVVAVHQKHADWIARFAGELECKALPFPYLSVAALHKYHRTLSSTIHPDIKQKASTGLANLHSKFIELSKLLNPSEKIDLRNYAQDGLTTALNEGNAVCALIKNGNDVPNEQWVAQLPVVPNFDPDEAILRNAKRVLEEAKADRIIATREAQEAEANAQKQEAKAREAEAKAREAEIKRQEAEAKTQEEKIKRQEAEADAREAEVKRQEDEAKTREEKIKRQEAEAKAREAEAILAAQLQETDQLKEILAKEKKRLESSNPLIRKELNNISAATLPVSVIPVSVFGNNAAAAQTSVSESKETTLSSVSAATHLTVTPPGTAVAATLISAITLSHA